MHIHTHSQCQFFTVRSEGAKRRHKICWFEHRTECVLDASAVSEVYSAKTGQIQNKRYDMHSAHKE